MKELINYDRCEKAMHDIRVSGLPLTGIRLKQIEEAISLIQKDGKNALKKEYLWVKNYAHFGDQEGSSSYGMSPTHGSIVFEIARVDRNEVELGEDHIYFLECIRDFGYMPIGLDRYGEKKYSNLNEILIKKNSLEDDLEILRSFLHAKVVETQLPGILK